jgi:hypothetical protein
MNLKKILSIVVFLVFGIVLIYILYIGKNTLGRNGQDSSLISQLPQSPLEASYLIEGNEIQFEEGTSRVKIGEDTITLEVAQDPIYGDMSGDGVEDAVLLITYSKNNEPRTYYVALALKDTDGYLGMNAVPLHTDGGEPQEIQIQDEVLVVTYTLSEFTDDGDGMQGDRLYEYLTLVGITLQHVGPLEERDEIERGVFTYTDDTKTFMTCTGSRYQISPNSRARAVLEAIYLERTRYSGADKNEVYVVLAGHVGGSADVSAEEVREEPDISVGGPSAEAGTEEVADETPRFVSGSNFLVSTILSAPKEGSCAPVVESTAPSEEAIEIVQ